MNPRPPREPKSERTGGEPPAERIRHHADSAHLSESSLTASAESRRVLLVEDERRLREMLLTSIREMGLEPTGVSSAESFLKALEQTPFATAVVDLNLPGMGGMDLCHVIRKRWPAVQIVILTGFGDLDSARRAIRLDVADFLTKPCGMDELELALSRARVRWLDHWKATLMRGGPSHAPHEPSQFDTESRDPAPGGDSPAPSLQSPPAALNLPQTPAAPPSPLSLEEMERQLVLAALERHHGNRDATAVDLGISIRKLYYRLRQYQKQGFLPED